MALLTPISPIFQSRPSCEVSKNCRRFVFAFERVAEDIRDPEELKFRVNSTHRRLMKTASTTLANPDDFAEIMTTFVDFQLERKIGSLRAAFTIAKISPAIVSLSFLNTFFVIDSRPDAFPFLRAQMMGRSSSSLAGTIA